MSMTEMAGVGGLVRTTFFGGIVNEHFFPKIAYVSLNVELRKLVCAN